MHAKDVNSEKPQCSKCNELKIVCVYQDPKKRGRSVKIGKEWTPLNVVNSPLTSCTSPNSIDSLPNETEFNFSGLNLSNQYPLDLDEIENILLQEFKLSKISKTSSFNYNSESNFNKYNANIFGSDYRTLSNFIQYSVNDDIFKDYSHFTPEYFEEPIFQNRAKFLSSPKHLQLEYLFIYGFPSQNFSVSLVYLPLWPEHETFLDWVENISDPDQLLYAYDCGIATCPKFYYYSYLSLCPLRLKEDVDSNLAKCRNYTAHATLLMSQLSEIEKLNESSILGCFQLILTFIMICEVKKARKLLAEVYRCLIHLQEEEYLAITPLHISILTGYGIMLDTLINEKFIFNEENFLELIEEQYWYGIGGKRAGSPGLVYKSRCVDKDALCMQAIFLLRRAIKLGEEEKNQTMSSLSAAVNMCLPQQSAQAVHNSILAWFLRLPTDLKLFESFESFLKKNENNNFNLNLNDVEEKIRILPLNLLMLLSILTCHKFNYKKNLLNSEKFKISEKDNAQQFNSTDFILIVIRSLIYSLKFKNVDFKKKNFYFSYNTDVVLANIIKEIVKIFLDLTKPGHPWDQDETIKNEVKVYINILLSIVKLRDTFYFQLLLIELLHLLKDLNI